MGLHVSSHFLPTAGRQHSSSTQKNISLCDFLWACIDCICDNGLDGLLVKKLSQHLQVTGDELNSGASQSKNSALAHWRDQICRMVQVVELSELLRLMEEELDSSATSTKERALGGSGRRLVAEKEKRSRDMHGKVHSLEDKVKELEGLVVAAEARQEELTADLESEVPVRVRVRVHFSYIFLVHARLVKFLSQQSIFSYMCRTLHHVRS